MYIEGDVPFVTSGGNNNSGFGGSGDGWWGIILLALLFGGRGFGGFGGGIGGGSSELLGYELGKVATTNDVASGFNNSAVLSSLNDIKLGQSQMQNFINQGFAGLNTTFIQGQKVKLKNTKLYASSSSEKAVNTISGEYYIYDDKVKNDRMRITNSKNKVGKKPVGENVTGYVKKSEMEVIL